MLTVQDATEYLTQLGLSLPAGIVSCLVAQVNEVEACLIGAGVSACNIKLLQLYAFAVIALGSGARRIRSQTAPSGASQSFEYGTTAEQNTYLRANIRALDKTGCLSPLLPLEPGKRAGMIVGLGRRACR